MCRTPIIGMDFVKELESLTHGDYSALMREGFRHSVSRRYAATLGIAMIQRMKIPIPSRLLNPTRSFFCGILFATHLAAQNPPPQHVKVCYEPGRFGGWPANHGIWSWENEILVGFSLGEYQDQGDRHHINHDRPEEHCLARSLDGGKTWSVEHPNANGELLPEGVALHGTQLPDVPLPKWIDFDGSLNFTDPNFAMTLRMTDNHKGPSRFFYSTDRGHRWNGPFRVPDLDTPGIAARTDYIPLSSEECLLFLTSAKKNKREGRPLCVRLSESGRRWTFQSWIGPEPDGFSIMPSTVQTSPGHLYTALRRRNGPNRWLGAYASHDYGKSWTQRPAPIDDLGAGNPASLVRLKDGRLCLTYGVRKSPYRIAAKLSADAGETWTTEIIINGNGSSADIGYPQSVQRTDGKVVTIYYISDAKTGPERYIGATIWSP